MGRTLDGWALLTNDLDLVTFPPELLAPGPVAVGVEVTHFRPEGAAWGAYLIYLVTPGRSNIQSARLDARWRAATAHAARAAF
jgi:hypothetical protein